MNAVRVQLAPPLQDPARLTTEHHPWCVHHSPRGCLGTAMDVPGSKITVWLSAPTPDDPRLIVDGPGGVVEIPVEP
ncbi:MAG: hypothetical protein GXX79_16480 [Actinomycetales bacterium]|nr:hypothetical protein [Actinomycetales bacterium]